MCGCRSETNKNDYLQVMDDNRMGGIGNAVLYVNINFTFKASHYFTHFKQYSYINKEEKKLKLNISKKK